MNSAEKGILIAEGKQEEIYKPKKRQQHFVECALSVASTSLEDKDSSKPYDMQREDVDSKGFDALKKFIDGELEADSIDWDSVVTEVVKNSGVLYLLSQNLYEIKRKMSEAKEQNQYNKVIKEKLEYVFSNLKDIIIATLISGKVGFLENLDDFFWHENVLKQVIDLADTDEKRLLIGYLEQILGPVSMFSQLIHEQSKRSHSYTNEDDSDKILMFIKFMIDNESVAYQEHIRQMLSARGVPPIEIKEMMSEGYASISDQSATIIKTLDEDLSFDYPYGDIFISVSFLKNELGRVFKVPRELFESWHFNDSKDKTSLITRLSFMEQIETMARGGVQLLHDNYGICEFNRYPLGMLIDQIKKHDELIPYGVVIFPKSDHNDAFDRDLDLLFSLYEQMRGEYLVRFFECGNGQDVYRSLSGLNSKYGDENKISFMILGGHGGVNSIQLGDEHVSSGSFTSIEKDMITNSSGLSRVRDYFTPSPQVVLFSCSTGVKGGIAEELSKKLGARVVAPKVPTSPKSIRFIEDIEGQITFDVKYNDGDKAALYVGK